MSNDADMRFLLKEIANMKEIIAAMEDSEDRNEAELKNFRQRLNGLEAELASRK